MKKLAVLHPAKRQLTSTHCLFGFLVLIATVNLRHSQNSLLHYLRTEIKVPSKGQGLAITIGFNYLPDPQRLTVVEPTFEYLESWYTSLHRHPPMQGLVISNMYDKAFREEYTDDQVKFYDLDPTAHPSFTEFANSSIRSMNDQRYLVVEAVLNETLFANSSELEYVVMTDSWDVEFLRNPFEYMQAIDEVMGEPQIYVGEEYNPEKLIYEWFESKWQDCFQQKRPHNTRFFNAGIVGGHISVMKKLLRAMNEEFLHHSNIYEDCNMQVLERVILEHFQSNVIGGYPLNTKFYLNETDSSAFIKHKL